MMAVADPCLSSRNPARRWRRLKADAVISVCPLPKKTEIARLPASTQYGGQASPDTSVSIAKTCQRNNQLNRRSFSISSRAVTQSGVEVRGISISNNFKNPSISLGMTDNFTFSDW